MTRKELGELLFVSYNKGWFDGHEDVDGADIFSAELMDKGASVLDELLRMW